MQHPIGMVIDFTEMGQDQLPQLILGQMDGKIYRITIGQMPSAGKHPLFKR